MKKIFLALLVTLGLSTCLSTPAFAQEENTNLNVTISPSVVEIVANPGDTVHQKFTIRNNGNSTNTLSITVEKLVGRNDTQEAFPAPGEAKDTYLSWLKLDSAIISAKPKEWTTVSFTLSVPKEAAFGYYYALVIGPSAVNTKTNTPSAKLLGQVVLPILVNVKSPLAKAALKIVDFKTDAMITEYLPVNFLLKLANNGNVYMKPRGNIFIKTGANDVGTLDINEALGNILPQTTRTFVSTWTDGFIVQENVLEDGQVKLDKYGKPVTHFVINWNKLTHFRIGKYTATALVVYDNGQKDVAVEATTSFFVFPYTALGILTVFLLVVILLGRFLLKWYIVKEVKKYSKE